MRDELVRNNFIHVNETSSNLYHPVVREDEHDSWFYDPLPPHRDKQRKCLNKEYPFGLGCGRGPHLTITTVFIM